MKTELLNIANQVRNTKEKNLETRKSNLIAALRAVGAKVVVCESEKPATGRAFGVTELKDRYRINFRCGYGRWNYAPCVEVMKGQETTKKQTS